MVVLAGAEEAGAEALGCCTVFSSLTLHAPTAAATAERAIRVMKRLKAGSSLFSAIGGNGRSPRRLRGTEGRGSTLVF